MTTWTWVLGNPPPTGVTTRELTHAYGRTLTWRLDAACTAQFSLDGRTSEAAVIVPLATDLHVYREGVKMYRGRIGPESDDIGASSHSSQFTATDYRGMLAYRIVGAAGAAYVATAAGAIAWNLITTSQALSGGNWSITAGVGTATGTVRDRTIDAGKPLMETIAEMGQLDNGYEWEIDETLALNLWHPLRGSSLGVVLDYGGLVASVRRQLDPGDFANSILATASAGVLPSAAVTAGIATDPRGRWELSASFPTIVEQATLTARGLWLVTQATTLRPTYSVTMRPGYWRGKAHVWLGDIVTLVVNSGRLAIAAAHRVVEVAIQLSEDGDETVTLGLQPQ